MTGINFEAFVDSCYQSQSFSLLIQETVKVSAIKTKLRLYVIRVS